jgi:hypothetical protein
LFKIDLLRKYGFVDENNMYDIVELNGRFVVDTISIDEDTKDKKVKFDLLCNRHEFVVIAIT